MNTHASVSRADSLFGSSQTSVYREFNLYAETTDSSQTLNFYRNGVAGGTLTNMNGPNGLVLGGLQAPTDGWIVEVLIYSRALSTSERQNLEG